MKSTSKILPLIAVLQLSASVLAADEEPQPSGSTNYEEVIVTANRYEQPLSEALSVSTVITRDDIDRVQARDFVDLLNREAGVSFVRNGGRGASTSISLRGNQADHSLILIDGIRIGSATLGSTDLSVVNLDLVERIEIVRGPKSSLYGADAIGGVINIITRKDNVDAMSSIQADFAFGSNNTTDAKLSGLWAKNATRVQFNLGQFETDGIDFTESQLGFNGDEDSNEQISFGLSLSQGFGDNLKANLGYVRTDGESEYDQFCSFDCDIFADTLSDTLSVGFNAPINDRYEAQVQFGKSRDESINLARNGDIGDSFPGGTFNTEKTEASWLNFLTFDKNQFTLGADYLEDSVNGTTAYDEDSRDNKALFAQWQYSANAVSLSLSTRYDDNEQFDSFTTYSAQVGFQASDLVRVIASYAEGFKAPTFNDLYFPNFGNPDLVPEESSNFELSMTLTDSIANVYIAAYRNNVDNLIQFGSQTAEAKITGIEFDAGFSLSNLQLGFAGSIINPENAANGNRLRRQPTHSLSIDADTRIGRFDLGGSIRMESSRFENTANTIELGGYGIADLRASTQLGNNWQLKAQINNVLDKEYTEAFSFGLGSYQRVEREFFLQVSYTPN